MTHCPVCGVDFDSKEACPSCGSRVNGLAHREKDAEYLAKDRWTFSESARDLRQKQNKASAEPSAKTKKIAREPTQAMHVFKDPTPGRIEREVEVTAPSKVKQLEETVSNRDLTSPAATEVMHVFGRNLPQKEKKDATSGASKLKSTMIGLSPMDIRNKAIPLPLAQVKGKKEEQEPRVHIEPVKVSVKATAPLEIRIGQFSSSSPTNTAKASAGDSLSLRGRGNPAINLRHPGFQISLAVSSAILILTWFVPDAWTANPVFGYKLLNSAHGIELISILVRPTMGAVLLALLVAPFDDKAKAAAALPVGIAALAVPLLLSEPPLPLQGKIIIISAVVNIAVAVVIFTQTEYKVFGHIALALVPGTLMGIAAIGIAIGKLPLAQLSAVKAPLAIYAAMLVSSIAASALIESIREKRKT